MLLSRCLSLLQFNIVRLQPGYDKRSQMEQLLRYTSTKFAATHFEPASKFEDGTMEGVALLSKFPMFNITVLPLRPLPHDQDRLNRSVVHARVVTPRGPIDVFAAHLSYEKDQQVCLKSLLAMCLSVFASVARWFY